MNNLDRANSTSESDCANSTINLGRTISRLIIVIFAISILGLGIDLIFKSDFSGFLGYQFTTITNTTESTVKNNVKTLARVVEDKTVEEVIGKTWWDWLDLIAIPLTLALIAVYFDTQLKERDEKTSNEQKEREENISRDREEQAALQKYLDAMTHLLLEKGLLTSGEDSNVRNIAQARTHTVLHNLNGKRRGSVVRFLQESKLIRIRDPKKAYFKDPKLYLSGANLRKAELNGLYLSKVSLTGVILEEADLRGADLSEADLRRATLKGAIYDDKTVWKGAIYNKETVWPKEDFDPRQAEAILLEKEG